MTMSKRWESDGSVERVVWIGFGIELPTLLHLLHLLGPVKRDWLQQKKGKRGTQDTSFSFQQRQSGWKGKSLLSQ